MVSIFTAGAQYVRIVFEYRWIQHMGVYRYVWLLISELFSFILFRFTAFHLVEFNLIHFHSRNVNVMPIFFSVYCFQTGYMLLYLTVLQILAQFCAHLVNTDTAAAIWLMIIIFVWSSVGGYACHIGELPWYLWDAMEYISPQRWLFPVLIASEFSPETLANSASQTLCRSKQVSLIVLWVNNHMQCMTVTNAIYWFTCVRVFFMLIG